MKELIILSLKESFTKWRGWTVASLAGILGIFVAGKSYFNLPLEYSIITGFIILIFAYVIIFLYQLYANISKERTLDTKNVYGDAIIDLANCFSEIHELRYFLKSRDVDLLNIRQSLVSYCSSLKNIYEKKTKAKCSVCIKVIARDNLTSVEPETEVITLCRDKEHETKRVAASNHSLKHTIIENSAFINIFNYTGKQQGNYYMNNNLPADLGYKNSSFPVYGDALPAKMTNEKDRAKNWPLPYKSEIVVPLRSLKRPEERKYKLLGFLCVDCSNIKCFNLRYDVELLRGAADGIVDIIEEVYERDK